jgi:hypothetical protein
MRLDPMRVSPRPPRNGRIASVLMSHVPLGNLAAPSQRLRFGIGLNEHTH